LGKASHEDAPWRYVFAEAVSRRFDGRMHFALYRRFVSPHEAAGRASRFTRGSDDEWVSIGDAAPTTARPLRAVSRAVQRNDNRAHLRRSERHGYARISISLDMQFDEPALRM
jgi:hypothetical protein